MEHAYARGLAFLGVDKIMLLSYFLCCLRGSDMGNFHLIHLAGTSDPVLPPFFFGMAGIEQP